MHDCAGKSPGSEIGTEPVALGFLSWGLFNLELSIVCRLLYFSGGLPL